MSGLISTFLSIHNRPGKASGNHYQSKKSENPYDESTQVFKNSRDQTRIRTFHLKTADHPCPNREKRAYPPSWGCRTSRSFRRMNSKSLRFRHSHITQKKRDPTARIPFQPQPQRNRHISQLGPERRHVIGEIMPEPTQENRNIKNEGSVPRSERNPQCLSSDVLQSEVIHSSLKAEANGAEITQRRPSR